LIVQLVSKISNLCDPDPPTSQTDRQTDGQTTCNLNTALCTRASRGKNAAPHSIPCSEDHADLHFEIASVALSDTSGVAKTKHHFCHCMPPDKLNILVFPF